MVVGGSIGMCVFVVTAFAALLLSGAVRAPTILTPGFLIVVVAMGYELSWDVVAAAQIAARLRLSEASLRASEERFRAVVESVPSAILLVDAQGTIRLANTQAEALFGHPRAAMVGRAVDMLIPPRFRAGHDALRRTLSRAGADSAPRSGRKPRGRRPGKPPPGPGPWRVRSRS